MLFPNKITRRAFIVLTIKGILFFVLAMKLVHMQIFNKAKYLNLDKKNRIKVKYLPPKRGNILDRNNNFIAKRTRHFNLIFCQTKNTNLSAVVNQIEQILAIPNFAQNIQKKLHTCKKIDYSQLILLEKLTWPQIVKIEENLPHLQGASVKIVEGREYYYPTQLAHITGYVGLMTEEEKRKNKNISNPKDTLVGKTGIEQCYDEQLSGSQGTQITEIDVDKKKKTIKSETPKINGEDIKITIDIQLQQHVISVMHHYAKGAAVVMDITTGEIISLVSLPTFNTNKMLETTTQYHNKIFSNKNTPLLNRVTQANYSPGSIFKIVTFLAALNNGIPKSTIINCTGSMQIADRVFKCWNQEGHGKIDMASALKHSCNCYTYTLGKELGAKKIMEMVHLLNINTSNIDLAYEYKSYISKIDPDIIRSKFDPNKKWTIGDTINLCIGQGFASMTVIEMLKIINIIATGGKIIQPKINQKREVKIIDSSINISHIKFIQKCLFNGVNSIGGTSYSNRININGMQFAGKTGTAQLCYNNLKDHSLFVGYGPYNSPKYSLAIILENAGWGSQHAAPAGSKIFSYLFEKMTKKTHQNKTELDGQ